MMPMRFLRNTLHPERYQGGHRRYPYFEGWYYKLIDASEEHRYAVIPGIYKGRDAASSHAFVQFMDGTTGEVTYVRYPLTEFQAAERAFEVLIGLNRFTAEATSLHLETPERNVRGSLRFSGINPWPVTLLSPGVMGWYAWVPFMECYHGVLSLDHTIEGILHIDGTAVDFSGGRGYTEKDWGRRFPAAWVWFQSNHFDTPGTSITASVAIIPWLGSTFRGTIVGLWHGGRLYRFTTYTGARIEQLAIEDKAVTWVMRDRHYRLELYLCRAEAGLLYAPDIEDMSGRVAETLHATATARLVQLDRSRPTAILEDTARNGGLEVVGDVQRLMTLKERSR